MICPELVHLDKLPVQQASGIDPVAFQNIVNIHQITLLNGGRIQLGSIDTAASYLHQL